MQAILPAVPGSLSRARGLVGDVADAPEDAVENAKLVLTELMANEIQHGRYDQTEPLVCRVERTKSSLRIEVSHSGPPFELPAAWLAVSALFLPVAVRAQTPPRPWQQEVRD